MLDASISYGFGSTLLSLWGLNLTGNDSWSQAYDVGAAVGFAGLWTYAATRPPRAFGVRLTHTF